MAGLQKVGRLDVRQQFFDIPSRQRQMQHVFPVTLLHRFESPFQHFLLHAGNGFR